MVTLTLSYICENNFYGTIETNYHYALYHAGTAFGPAVGMLVAGQFTNVWVDWYDKGLSPPGELSTDSKLWVGTWWLPYWIVSGVLFIIGSFIVCFVPETLVSSYQAHQLDETLSNRTESTCVSGKISELFIRKYAGILGLGRPFLNPKSITIVSFNSRLVSITNSINKPQNIS